MSCRTPTRSGRIRKRITIMTREQALTALKCITVMALVTASIATTGSAALAQATTLEIWSHEASEPAKVAFREGVAREMEKKHPGLTVKITWYEKNPLMAALKTALPAGQGPDVFYVEPDQIEYVTQGYVIALDDLVKWDNIYDWARNVWKHDGKTYGLPQEAYTNEIYYNKDLLQKLGVTLPASGQFTQSEFLDLVKKARAAGITPISQGVGDRPYPGAYISAEAMLRMLGADDYRKLLNGKLSFADPRVVSVLNWVKELVDAGAYPKNFMTLKLGESHGPFPHSAWLGDVPGRHLVFGSRFRPGRQGRSAEEFSDRHHAISGDGRRCLQRVQDVGHRR